MTSAAAAIGAVAAATSRAMDRMGPQARIDNDGGNKHEGRNNAPSAVEPVEITSYLELTNIGQAMEESSRRTVVARSNRQEYSTEKKGKKTKITPRSQNFKRGHFITSHSQRQNNDQRNDSRLDPNSEGQTSTQPEDLRCPRCKKYHSTRPCPAGLGVCYQCGKPGHIARNCPHKKGRDVAEFDSHT
ncbi:uncharacterized protein LOC107616431 [Arachis ipaensis]|uniref:uncharacterized protein LOC107616431 n=1 Tax=Arachis ipaensis TaxID=130454 RepID=UPI0007AF4FE8|nr:uncharacterized protein LOC107616431 [Arachis ipaensis]XP_025679008.1 uncharacterized protein LOC112778962 [Arachis hypogaea]